VRINGCYIACGPRDRTGHAGNCRVDLSDRHRPAAAFENTRDGGQHGAGRDGSDVPGRHTPAAVSS